jgi:predicted N-acyltransferase
LIEFNMPWTTEIIGSINQVDPDEWGKLVKDHPFTSQCWLQVTEAVLLGHQPRYVLLRHNGNLQAAAVCSLQSQFQSRLLQSTLGWFISRYPGLRCGVPISYDPGLFFHSKELAGDLLPELLQGIQTLIRREQVSFHTIDHILSVAPAWQFLQVQGYHRIEHLAEVYLDIQWVSFEDYFQHLSSKKRKEYVRIERRLEREGITLDVTDLLVEDEVVLQRLVNNVFQRHQEPTLYPDGLFSKAKALLGEDFKLIVARQNGESIGCMALLRDGNEWIVKWPGLNYERTLDTGTYYGLLAECIRQTIQASGTRLRMGATAYQTKQHFGVTVEKRIGALAFQNPLIHYLAGKALQVTAGLKIGWPIAQSSMDEKQREAK